MKRQFSLLCSVLLVFSVWLSVALPVYAINYRVLALNESQTLQIWEALGEQGVVRQEVAAGEGFLSRQLNDNEVNKGFTVYQEGTQEQSSSIRYRQGEDPQWRLNPQINGLQLETIMLDQGTLVVVRANLEPPQ